MNLLWKLCGKTRFSTLLSFLVKAGASPLILSTKFIILNLLFCKGFIVDIGWWMSCRGKLNIA